MAQSRRRTTTDKLLEKARQILREEGPEARSEFLRSHGVKSKNERIQVGLKKTGSDTGDEVKAQHVDCIEPTKCDGDIQVNIVGNFFPSSLEYVVGLDVRYRYQMWVSNTGYFYYDGPEPPVDGMSLWWDTDEYQITNTSYPANSMTSPQYGSWDNGSWLRDGKSGTGFRIKDKKVCGNSPYTQTDSWSNWDSCEVKLTSNGTSGDTNVYGAYLYTYQASSISLAIGASYPTGISFSISGSNSVKSEDFATNLDGEALQLDLTNWQP